MKTAVIYFSVLAGGAAAGAVSMGSYTALMVGEVTPAAATVADTVGAESETREAADAPQDSPVVADEVSGGSTAVPAIGDPAGLEPAALDAASSSVATVAVEQGEAPAAAASADSLARVAASYQRLAQIFAAMAPDEAAAVLTQLDDSQLEGILRAMQGRNAAPILAAMEPVRVAAVSRRLLEGRP